MKLEIISKYPTGNKNPTPLLFVHGAWIAAWCWDVHFLDFFARNGWEAHAVSLRGHGESEGRAGLKWTRIADYVEDVANAVKQLPTPPVLIGHSMGGFVVQKYLEDHNPPAAVLLASAPPAGVLALTLRTALRHPIALAKVNLTLSMLPLIASSDMVREEAYSEDLPEKQFLAYWARMQDESFAAYLDMMAFNLPKPGKVKTPLLVLGGARDKMFMPGEVEATARAYGVNHEIIPDLAHAAMLDPRWQSVAERILAWLKERRLTKQ